MTLHNSNHELTLYAASAFITSLLASVVLFGCAGDSSLRTAPESLPDETASTPAAGQSGGGWAGPASPWGDIHPGDLPDTVFAVAWVDLTEGCIDCYYGPNAPNRYDIVDPLGQVISSFEPPFVWEENQYYAPPLRSLEAAGRGRFIAVNAMLHGEEAHLVVWEADAYTGEAQVIARIYQHRVELPLTGELLLLPDALWVWNMRVLPDPVRDDALLLVPIFSSPYTPTLLREIQSVPYRDAAAPLVRWSMDEFVDHLLFDDWDFMEPATVARLADDGSGELVLGLRGWLSADEDTQGPMFVSELTSFLPDGELYDVRGERVPNGLLRPEARVALAGDGHGTVVLTSTDSSCGPLTWWEDGEGTQIGLPETDVCPVLGALLDIPSQTFIYAARYGDPQFYGAQRLVVRGGGQELWSLDRFALGLSERPFHLLGSVVLER